MFSSLVESGSHAKDFKRKGTFFLGALVFYGLLLVAFGVGSIYAFNAQLNSGEELHLLAFMKFPATESKQSERRRAAPEPASGRGQKLRPATVTDVVKNTPHLSDRPVAANEAPVLPPGMDFEIGAVNLLPPNPSFGGDKNGDPNGSPRGTNSGEGLPRVGGDDGEPPPRIVKPAPTPTPQPIRSAPKQISLPSHILVGKAVHKPTPPYPELAKKMGIRGSVPVQILVDEQGRVVSAKATGGHALLAGAAERAALQARFAPTVLNGQPVKVSGVMTYNFVLD